MLPDLRRRWLDEVEELAEQALPPAVFRYLQEGARDEITLRESVEAWQALRVIPRVLRDVREVDVARPLLGQACTAPLGVAPMTLQRAADPDGEVAMARAAAAAGLPLVLSSNAGSTFADVAATGVTWWLQVYVAADRDDTLPLLEAAVESGASAVVLTVDTPVLGTRYPLAEGPRVWELAEAGWLGANAGVTTTGLDPADRDKALDLGPEDLVWLAERTGLPVVAKGVLGAEDARRCVDAGVRGVWVSNHGGRQLDQAMATAACVGPVSDAVAGRAEVYVDGGIRSGLHALLALALGADAVFVGRPLFHALAAGGEQGVRRALDELVVELVEALRLAGCAELAQARGIARFNPVFQRGQAL